MIVYLTAAFKSLEAVLKSGLLLKVIASRKDEFPVFITVIRTIIVGEVLQS